MIFRAIVRDLKCRDHRDISKDVNRHETAARVGEKRHHSRFSTKGASSPTPSLFFAPLPEVPGGSLFLANAWVVAAQLGFRIELRCCANRHEKDLDANQTESRLTGVPKLRGFVALVLLNMSQIPKSSRARCGSRFSERTTVSTGGPPICALKCP